MLHESPKRQSSRFFSFRFVKNSNAVEASWHYHCPAIEDKLVGGNHFFLIESRELFLPSDNFNWCRKFQFMTFSCWKKRGKFKYP
jgi:hypothetical protein